MVFMLSSEWENTALDRIKWRVKAFEGVMAWEEIRITDRKEALCCVARSLHKQIRRDSCATFATSHAKETLGSRRICNWAADNWITQPPHMGSRR